MARIVGEGGCSFGSNREGAFAERDYAEAFRAVSKRTDREASRVAFERLRGWGHWSALNPLLPNERLPVVISRRDWQHWGLFRVLLDAARSYSFRDPHEAVNIVLWTERSS